MIPNLQVKAEALLHLPCSLFPAYPGCFIGDNAEKVMATVAVAHSLTISRSAGRKGRFLVTKFRQKNKL